jgi:hypothetical protein
VNDDCLDFEGLAVDDARAALRWLGYPPGGYSGLAPDRLSRLALLALRTWLDGEDPYEAGLPEEVLGFYAIACRRERAAAADAAARDLRGSLAVLGLSWPCTPDEADAAYRRCARENHPDRGGDNEPMRQVNAAYEQLRNYFRGEGETA